ncbi:methylmalonyl Co-A mutase-associated GTPase MeaB, partial [Streptomyces sp. SID13726]|nr:methylmalonyl Co-A mutase-associated GTPase MeaB [Streptomyces sp. SID13726]
RLEQHGKLLDAVGRLAAKRAEQQVEWTWSMVREELLERLRANPAVRGLAPGLEAAVRAGAVTPTSAADRILAAFTDRNGPAGV